MKSFYFFHNGPLSQWYSASFTDNHNITYSTAEQYMMYRKAVLFNDINIAEQILATSNPKLQKSLGRQVNHFDESQWNAVARDIVYNGNKLKFQQNFGLLNFLLGIEEDLIVEASKYDKIWGIGLNETVAKTIPEDKWPGTNWLGLTLTNLRDDLR